MKLSTQFIQKKLDELLLESAENYQVRQPSIPVTFRVKQVDLIKLKMRARDLGMPYQTLLSVLIHNYVEGKILLNI